MPEVEAKAPEAKGPRLVPIQPPVTLCVPTPAARLVPASVRFPLAIEGPLSPRAPVLDLARLGRGDRAASRQVCGPRRLGAPGRGLSVPRP